MNKVEFSSKILRAPKWTEIITGELFGEMLVFIWQGKEIIGGLLIPLICPFVAFGVMVIQVEKSENRSSWSLGIDYESNLVIYTIIAVMLVELILIPLIIF